MEFIKAHLVVLLTISTILQVGGTAVLALFSFHGIEIKENPEAYLVDIQKVSINPKWLRLAQFGLVALVIGILLAGVISIATATG